MRKGERRAGVGTGALEGSLGEERNESVKSKDRVHASEWNAMGKWSHGGWNNWRKMRGDLCDKKVPPHVKGNIHKMIVQPAMLYGMETVPVTSSHLKKLEMTETKMCRWACGHTLRDQVRNDDIRERLKVENITER